MPNKNTGTGQTKLPLRAGPSRLAKGKVNPPRRLAALPASAFRIPYLVPTRWIKAVIGLFLLPVCWVFSQTFFANFSRINSAPQPFWQSEEFWFFALGALLWVIAFFGLPRPLLLYVFGHELTHAMWVWVSGGRVSAFKVGRDGGYIVTDTNNVLVSLAPYFFPLYSLVAIVVWSGIGIWHPELWEHRRWLFAIVGATWAFHLSFTCWMIPKKQPDLLLHGTFFSLVVIYLANLIVLTILLLVACPDLTWDRFARDFIDNAADFSAWVRSLAGV